ncbi:MAG: hypothetical protein IPI07_08265 [Flavobacteriales bacterium]|nr:hypothetical protein [Flavobacteriales bacterium]
MSFGILAFLKLVGPLGLFIYGMKVMIEGLQKVAGNSRCDGPQRHDARWKGVSEARIAAAIQHSRPPP